MDRNDADNDNDDNNVGEAEAKVVLRDTNLLKLWLFSTVDLS
jgi:hypothetical protein